MNTLVNRVARTYLKMQIMSSVNLKWVLSSLDKGRGKVLATINVSKADKAWQRHAGGSYVPSKGYPDYQGKLARLRALVEEGVRSLDAPSVSYDSVRGVFGITDGRHRIALARELGLKTIRVAIYPDQKEALESALR